MMQNETQVRTKEGVKYCNFADAAEYYEQAKARMSDRLSKLKGEDKTSDVCLKNKDKEYYNA